MPLNKDLIDILACPKCKGKIDLRPDETAFVCRGCRLVFAVTDEIPNFILEEATALKD